MRRKVTLSVVALCIIGATTWWHVATYDSRQRAAAVASCMERIESLEWRIDRDEYMYTDTQLELASMSRTLDIEVQRAVNFARLGGHDEQEAASRAAEDGRERFELTRESLFALGDSLVVVRQRLEAARAELAALQDEVAEPAN